MTLYELWYKVSFDEIAPFLSKSYAEGKSLAWFKMHYDYLCHLVPLPKSETGYDIYVEMVDAGRRCDYLKELIKKYDLAKGLNQHNSIISISASPKHPLQPQELETLQRLLYRSVSEPQFCLKADDTLGEDLRIDFAFYSM